MESYAGGGSLAIVLEESRNLKKSRKRNDFKNKEKTYHQKS